MTVTKPANDHDVIEQRDVTFYDDELTAERAADGHEYLSVRHMCDSLDLRCASQVNRIRHRQNNDPDPLTTSLPRLRERPAAPGRHVRLLDESGLVVRAAESGDTKKWGPDFP